MWAQIGLVVLLQSLRRSSVGRGLLGPIENVPIWELGGHGVERGLVVVGFTLLSCPEASQCTCHCLPTTHPTTTTTITDISIDFSLSVVSTTAHKTLSI